MSTQTQTNARVVSHDHVCMHALLLRKTYQNSTASHHAERERERGLCDQTIHTHTHTQMVVEGAPQQKALQVFWHELPLLDCTENSKNADRKGSGL